MGKDSRTDGSAEGDAEEGLEGAGGMAVRSGSTSEVPASSGSGLDGREKGLRSHGMAAGWD